jgi:hypothetical protein
MVVMPLSPGNKALAPPVLQATTLRLMPTELGRLLLSALIRTTTLVTTSVALALSLRLTLPNSELHLSASELLTFLLVD